MSPAAIQPQPGMAGIHMTPRRTGRRVSPQGVHAAAPTGLASTGRIPPGVVQRSGQRVGAGIIEQVLRKDRLQGVAAVEIVARLVGLVGLVAACAVLGERAGGRGAAAAIAQHRLMPSSNWETGIRFDASTLHGASPPRCTEHRRRPSPAPAQGSARPQAQRSRPRDLVPTQRGPEERAPRHKFPLGRRG